MSVCMYEYMYVCMTVWLGGSEGTINRSWMGDSLRSGTPYYVTNYEVNSAYHPSCGLGLRRGAFTSVGSKVSLSLRTIRVFNN